MQKLKYDRTAAGFKYFNLHRLYDDNSTKSSKGLNEEDESNSFIVKALQV